MALAHLKKGSLMRGVIGRLVALPVSWISFGIVVYSFKKLFAFWGWSPPDSIVGVFIGLAVYLVVGIVFIVILFVLGIEDLISDEDLNK